MDLTGNPSCGGFDDGQGVKNRRRISISNQLTDTPPGYILDKTNIPRWGILIMEEIAMNIGEKIRTLRQESHLTQDALASQLGVSAQAVNGSRSKNKRL